MSIGTPSVGPSRGQVRLIVDHSNGAQFYFEPLDSGSSGVMPAGTQAEQEALMQAMVTALDGHSDLTVQATLVYDAGATITP